MTSFLSSLWWAFKVVLLIFLIMVAVAFIVNVFLVFAESFREIMTKNKKKRSYELVETGKSGKGNVNNLEPYMHLHYSTDTDIYVISKDGIMVRKLSNADTDDPPKIIVMGGTEIKKTTEVDHGTDRTNIH